MHQRLAIVSHSLPPSPGGQAAMIERLLMGDDAPRPVLVCTDRRAPAPPGVHGRDWVRCHTPWALRKVRRLPRLQAVVFRADVWMRAARIARAAQATGCGAIIACTGGDLIDLPAAIAAGRRTGLPVFLHYFDDYRFQWRIPNPAWHPTTAAALGAVAEHDVLAGAAGVVVSNEVLADEIRARADVPLAIVRNPIDTASATLLRREAEASRSHGGERVVLYTGSVYEAQGDALRRCAAAIDVLRGRGHELRLHVYTAEPEDRIREQRLPGSVAIHPAVSPAAAAALQSRADVLFLPLGFDTRYPELIRSSAPSKFGEYLASGRPMLVHAPADAFPATYASRAECGAVCDTPDPDVLAAALLRLLEDDRWTRRLIERAVAASETFSIVENRRVYRRFIDAHIR